MRKVSQEVYHSMETTSFKAHRQALGRKRSDPVFHRLMQGIGVIDRALAMCMPKFACTPGYLIDKMHQRETPTHARRKRHPVFTDSDASLPGRWFAVIWILVVQHEESDIETGKREWLIQDRGASPVIRKHRPVGLGEGGQLALEERAMKFAWKGA